MSNRRTTPARSSSKERERTRLRNAITRSGTMFVVGLLLTIYEASPVHRGQPRPVLIGLYALMMGLGPLSDAVGELLRRDDRNEP